MSNGKVDQRDSSTLSNLIEDMLYKGERLIDSEDKVKLLNLFRKTPEGSQHSLEELEKKLRMGSEEISKALSYLVEIGLIKRTELFSFDHERYKALQRQIRRDTSIKVDKMLMKSLVGMTGVKVLDSLLPEGYPSGSTILIQGDQGAGAEILAQQMLGEALKTGRKGYYLTFDHFPDEVRRALNLMGYNIESLELRGGSLCFADFYSSAIGVKSDEKYSETQLDLTTLEIDLGKIFQEQQRIFLVFDSLTSLINRHGVNPIQAFIHSLAARTKLYKANSITLLNRRAFPESVYASLSDIADGVIELKAEEKEGRIFYVMRVSKMRGVDHETSWAQYTAHPERGINPLHKEGYTHLY